MKTKISLREQLAGFPVWQIAVISMMRFSEPIAFTSLFPYMYFMVKDFGIADTEEEISRYCGYISSSFAFFQFLCSVHWGHLADIIGRKPVLLVGMFGTGVGMLCFGFSQSFWMAFASRAFMGAVNGNVAVIRTMIGEIAHDPRHTALALSLVPLLWQVGCILGPMSGYLVNTGAKSKTPELVARDSFHYRAVSALIPLSKRSLLENFTDKYPYALSNIVVALFLFASMIIGFLFLEETLESKKNRRDYGLELGDAIRRWLGYEVEPRSWNTYTRLNEEDTQLDTFESDSTSDSSKSPAQITTTHAPDTSYPWHILMSSKVRYTILSNFILAFHTVVGDELFPVFCSTQVARQDPSDPSTPLLSKFPRLMGGLGKDSRQVGNVLSLTGAVGFIAVFSLYPWIDRNFDPLASYKMLIFPMSAIYFFIPLLIFLLPPNHSEGASMAGIYGISIAKTFMGSLAFPQVFLLVHECSEPSFRAFVNGMALSFTSFARFLAPTIWGTIMTFSQKHNIAWLTWWSLSIIAAVGVYVTTYIKPKPLSLDEEAERARAN